MPIHAFPPTVPPATATMPAPAASRRAAAVIAVLFLGATATFLLGDALVLDALDGAVVDTGGLRLGVALQAVNAVAVTGLGVAFLRALPDRVSRLARGHLALRIVEAVVIVGLGGTMLARQALVDYEPVIYLFTGSAGLLLTVALARTQLVERWLVRLGAVGYMAILAALPLQLLTGTSLDTFRGCCCTCLAGSSSSPSPSSCSRGASGPRTATAVAPSPDERPFGRGCTRPAPRLHRRSGRCSHRHQA